MIERKKTYEEYKIEGMIDDKNKQERKFSDESYAQKRIEKLVDAGVKIFYGIVATAAGAFATILLKIVIEYLKSHQ